MVRYEKIRADRLRLGDFFVYCGRRGTVVELVTAGPNVTIYFNEGSIIDTEAERAAGKGSQLCLNAVTPVELVRGLHKMNTNLINCWVKSTDGTIREYHFASMVVAEREMTSILKNRLVRSVTLPHQTGCFYYGNIGSGTSIQLIGVAADPSPEAFSKFGK